MLPVISIIFLMIDQRKKKKKACIAGVSYRQKIKIGWRKYDFEIDLHNIDLYFIIIFLWPVFRLSSVYQVSLDHLV